MLTSPLFAIVAALATLSKVSAHVLVKVDADSGLAIDKQYRVIPEADELILKDLNQDYQFNILQNDGEQNMPTFTVVTRDPGGEFLECRIWGYGFVRTSGPSSPDFADREYGKTNKEGDIIPFHFTSYKGIGWGGKERQMIQLDHCGCTKTMHRLECRRKKRSGEYVGGDTWPGAGAKCGPGDAAQMDGTISDKPHCGSLYHEGDKTYEADGNVEYRHGA